MSKNYRNSINFKLIISYYFIFKITSLLKKKITHIHFTNYHKKSIHYSLYKHKYIHNKHYIIHLKKKIIRNH